MPHAADPIYLDHNASSPMRPRARRALHRALREDFKNPSSVHSAGMRARAALDEARHSIAACLELAPEGLIFTSGATESNNLAVLSTRARPGRDVIVTTPIEHPSVLEPIRHVCQNWNVGLRYFELDAAGRIRADAIDAAIDDRVVLVAVQAANHETGALQALDAIIDRTREVGARLHCDATQLVGKARPCFAISRCDSIAFSSHKIGGPAGIGALWQRDPSTASPVFFGGHQERGMRPGTESVPLAISFAEALRDASSTLDELSARCEAMREELLSALRERRIDHVVLSPTSARLPNTLALAFPGAPRLALTIQLDLHHVQVSPGAACASGSAEPSPVLRALGVPDELLVTALRFSFGWNNSPEQIPVVVDALEKSLARVRRFP